MAMTVSYNVKGAKRKELAGAIAEVTGHESRYLGMPSAAYRIGEVTIDRTGALHFSEDADADKAKRLIERLAERGFKSEAQTQEASLEVQMPQSLFTEAALKNLACLLEAKGALIRKALGIDELPVTRKDDMVCFPWFRGELTPDETKAYTHFISAICKMSREQKRISSREKAVENEKYAFRCFLLRLGFIGSEFKTERKILLRNLSGSSAFRTGGEKDAVSRA